MDDSPSDPPTMAYVLAGVGTAGILFGGFSGAMALSKNAEVDDICPNRVCADESSKRQAEEPRGAARSWLVVGAVSTVVGLVASGIGWYGLLSGSGKKSEARFSLSLDRDSAGGDAWRAVMRGRF